MKTLEFLLLLAFAVQGCDCIMGPPQKSFEWADAVLVGKVTKVVYAEGKEWAGRRVIVTFSVEQSWKERLPKSFVMHAQISHSACEGFEKTMLKLGNRLLVYAKKTPAEQWKRFDQPASLPDDQVTYSTNGCVRNQKLGNNHDGQEDLQYLNRTR